MELANDYISYARHVRGVKQQLWFDHRCSYYQSQHRPEHHYVRMNFQPSLDSEDDFPGCWNISHFQQSFPTTTFNQTIKFHRSLKWYSKHPHIRTYDFGVQADQVLIYQGLVPEGCNNSIPGINVSYSGTFIHGIELLHLSGTSPWFLVRNQPKNVLKTCFKNTIY